MDVAAAKPAGYKECGCGMGPALNMASGMNGYVLADRGTWLSFKARGDLAVLVEGDKRLFNQYGVMLVNPAKHPHVKKDLGQAFIDWVGVTRRPGQRGGPTRSAANSCSSRTPTSKAGAPQPPCCSHCASGGTPCCG